MPTPTNDQIEQTRQVLGLKSFSEVSSLISNLENDVQWTAQLADNETFLTEQDSVNDVKKVGDIEFFGDDILSSSILGVIRNRSRLRFGLSALANGATDAEVERQSAIGCLEGTLKYF